MFCENCGTKIEGKAEFCQNCGRKVSASSSAEVKPATSAPEPIKAGDVFYSEDWRRRNGLAIASLPYYDLMVDKDYLYVITMPKYSGATTGFILGLVVLNIIGAAIGSSIGSSSDLKKRKWYRSAWVNSDRQLTSREYVNDIFLKIPLKDLKNHILIAKKKFTLNYEDKKITLARTAGSFGSNAGKKEFERFNNSIHQYVL
jgi:hypothetical protein